MASTDEKMELPVVEEMEEISSEESSRRDILMEPTGGEAYPSRVGGPWDGNYLDDYDDPEERARDFHKYFQQDFSTNGFEVDSFPRIKSLFGMTKPIPRDPEMDKILLDSSELSIRTYNEKNGTNYKAVGIIYSTAYCCQGFVTNITIKAEDLNGNNNGNADGVVFRASVWEKIDGSKECLSCELHPKPQSKPDTLNESSSSSSSSKLMEPTGEYKFEGQCDFLSSIDHKKFDRNFLRDYKDEMLTNRGFSLHTYGYEVDSFPNGSSGIPMENVEIDTHLQELSELAICTYNKEHGTNYKVVGIIKATCLRLSTGFLYRITLKAEDVDGNGSVVFGASLYEDFKDSKEYVCCEILPIPQLTASSSLLMDPTGEHKFGGRCDFRSEDKKFDRNFLKDYKDDLLSNRDLCLHAYGYEVDSYRNVKRGISMKNVESDTHLQELSEFAIYTYNKEHGKHYKVVGIMKATCHRLTGGFLYCITLKAEDVEGNASNGSVVFGASLYEDLKDSKEEYISCEILPITASSSIVIN